MRSVFLLACACLVAAEPHAQPRSAAPFVPVGVAYAAAPSRTPDEISRDLQSIRARGFNSITTIVPWAEVERARGEYRFEAFERLLTLAAAAELRVTLRIEASSAPDWLVRRYPDGRFVDGSAKPGEKQKTNRVCLDHPGILGDATGFVRAVTERASRHAAWHAVDVGSDLPPGLCLCSHTSRRFEMWARTTRNRVTWMYATVRLQEHLQLLADASAARGPRLVSSHAAVPSVMQAPGGRSRGQDDWLMSGVVDVYGTSVHTEPQVQLAFALDGLRSATRDKGWLFSDNAADPRLMGWTALSRGARGLTFSDQGSPDGDRMRAAGALAGIVTRNPALFAPLRPRASKVAILYDPRAADADFAANTMPQVYRALFARNIQVDFIHLDEVADGAASRYRIVFRGSLSVLNQRAWDALNAYVKAGGTLVSAPGKSLTDARILELVTEAGAGPDVRLNGAYGVVETRFLESSDVIMLIGLNHGDLPQRVTLAFEPDTQEAIWQNMETGSAVNFVAGPEGPTYTYLFGPRSSLVLMIRKSIR